MSWVAVAIGGAAVGGVVGSKIQSNAAGDAADQQAAAAHEANQIQIDMYKQNRSDQEPWRASGIGALQAIDQNPDLWRDFSMSDFQQDPGYQFRMDQGQKALERSAAARGGLGSGATLKALSQYGQDYASNEYDKAYSRFNQNQNTRFNRLASLSGLGQTATGQVGASGSNAAGQIGNNTMGAANAAGAAGIASANAWGSAINGVTNAATGFGMLNYLKK